MRIPRPDDPRETGFHVAAEDAAQLAVGIRPLVERAEGVPWYELGNDADRAALSLCRLRRASAAQSGGSQHGDEAVRIVLAEASPEALVWIASRAISYMDENGYPETVERWFPEETEPDA
ncbi:MAG: hypothetical protein WD015_03675 [Gaiellaceae bacterium]